MMRAPSGHQAGVVWHSAVAGWRLLNRLLAAWRWRRERAEAIRALRAWDDQALKDIGLTRGEIRAAVDGELQRGEREPYGPPDGRAR